MNKFLSLALLFLITVTALAQKSSLQWVQRLTTAIPNEGSALGYDITTDNSGSVISTGYFEGSYYFGDSLLVGTNNATGFLAKHNCAGAITWVKALAPIGDYSANVYGQVVSTDGAGNIYVSGYFSQGLKMDTITLTSHSNSDVFIAKYSPQGKALWATNFAAQSLLGFQKLSISADYAGNCYITGTFYDSVTVESQKFLSKGPSDIYIGKFNTAGKLQWMKTVGGNQFDFGMQAVADSAGNLYVSGNYSDTIHLGTSTFITNSLYSLFVAKMDTKGNFKWAKSILGTFTTSEGGLAIDSKGNSTVTGLFHDYALFPTDTLYISNSCSFNGEIMLARYDSSGNFKWVVQAGGSCGDDVEDISSDPQGNVAITGSIQGTGSFGGTSYTSSGTGAQVYVAKYKANGTVAWVQQGSSDLMSQGRAVTMRQSGNVYMIGFPEVADSVTFDSVSFKGTEYTIQVFIVKYIDYVPTSIPNTTLSATGDSICNGSIARVRVDASQPGMIYQAFNNGMAVGKEADGNGATIYFNLPSYLLDTGNNTIKIGVRNSECYMIYLKDTANVYVRAPQPPYAFDVSRCDTGNITLTAYNGVSYRWYSDSLSTGILYTGQNYIIPHLIKTDSFFVSNFDGHCESARSKERALVLPLPIIGPITGSDTVYADSSYKYTVASHSGYYYWMVNGGTGTSYADTVVVTWGDTGAAQLSIVETSIHYCRDTSTLNITIVHAPVTAINYGATESISAYANGKAGSFTVQAANIPAGALEVQVTTGTGTQVLAATVLQNGGSFYKEFSVTTATEQLLIVRVITATQVYTTKIILN